MVASVAGPIWALLPQIDDDNGNSAVGLHVHIFLSGFKRVFVHRLSTAGLKHVNSTLRYVCVVTELERFRPWLGKLYRKLTKEERKRLGLSSAGVVKRKMNAANGKKAVLCT